MWIEYTIYFLFSSNYMMEYNTCYGINAEVLLIKFFIYFLSIYRN